ncbi:MAG: chemotaxis protein [Gammaproteobacteria bacterium]|nr:chemotaxis protein [Gammaproteobacteria bacterium]
MFGINVFKVREVLNIPEITSAPDMPDGVEGFVSLRGEMVPIINLQKFCNLSSTETEILMITEYNTQIQGFLVSSVDTILRLSWEQIKEPPPLLTKRLGGLVTAVSELPDSRLAMIMDVEKVLADTSGFYDEDTIFNEIETLETNQLRTILVADDSAIARKQIIRTLEHMRVNYISTNNGAQAWQLLNEKADQCADITKEIQLVLTDVEMPEMDGYVLTKKIKADPRLQHLPVIMHSSLTSMSNQGLR